jgi:hypothetical protein
MNSTLIVLENGETLRLTKSCQNQSLKKKVLNHQSSVKKSPSVISPSTEKKSSNSSSSPGISHNSPTNNGSGFVILKRIQPQPVPIFQSPPLLSSSPKYSTTSPRTRILPYSTQTDEKSIINVPHSSLSPELGLDHAKLPLFAPNSRLSSTSSTFQNNSKDPIFNQKLVDRDAGLITQFVEFRPLLIRSPQSPIETDSNGPRLVIPLQSPQTNISPSIPTRQSRLPHSALSPSAIGEINFNQVTLSIQSEDREKQIQLITRINNKERDGVSLMSQQEPVPKIFSKKPDSQSGIASIDEIDDVGIKRSLSRSSTFRDSSRISFPVEQALRNDQQINSLLQQLKLDLNMELSGVNLIPR